MEIAPPVNEMKSKKIDFNYDNQNYSLNLSYLLNIKISINCIDKRTNYYNEYSLEQIKNINKYFLMCDTINEVVDELTNNIKDNINVSYRDDNLILKILLPSIKNREAEFILNKEKNSLEDEINFLNEKVNEQEKIIKEQNIKIEKQEEDIKSLKDITSSLQKKVLFLESILSKKENKIKLNEEKKIKTLKTIIEKECNLTLLYQMKKDGNLCSIFHEKVDNKGPTITLFETEKMDINSEVILVNLLVVDVVGLEILIHFYLIILI